MCSAAPPPPGLGFSFLFAHAVLVSYKRGTPVSGQVLSFVPSDEISIDKVWLYRARQLFHFYLTQSVFKVGL
jgi:hypothetical protein